MKRGTSHPEWVELLDEQARADARVRDEVARIVELWTKLSAEQRAQIRARLRDKKA